MQVQLGIYKLDVDVDRTHRFYLEADGIDCDCDGCQNFTQAAASFPQVVQDFFRQFGVDLNKPAEIYGIYAPSDDSVFYGGFYHICGSILKGTEPWIPLEDNRFQLDEQYQIELDEEHIVFFTNDVQLLEDNFPTPVFQIEIHFTLPWLLNKPNSYI